MMLNAMLNSDYRFINWEKKELSDAGKYLTAKLVNAEKNLIEFQKIFPVMQLELKDNYVIGSSDAITHIVAPASAVPICVSFRSSISHQVIQRLTIQPNDPRVFVLAIPIITCMQNVFDFIEKIQVDADTTVELWGTVINNNDRVKLMRYRSNQLLRLTCVK